MGLATEEYLMYFNPRLREGGDKLSELTAEQGLISIHASAKEATAGRKPMLSLELISIHVSAKEATRRSPYVFRRLYFNPRLREGGDRNIL